MLFLAHKWKRKKRRYEGNRNLLHHVSDGHIFEVLCAPAVSGAVDTSGHPTSQLAFRIGQRPRVGPRYDLVTLLHIAQGCLAPVL